MPPVNEIWRYRLGQGLRREADEVAVEEPLEIRVRNRAVSVTMRTPGNDQELAAGFLLTEGIVSSRADIADIAPCALDRGGNVLNVTVSPDAEVDFERLTRHVFASSSCGMCGKATIESIHQRLEPVSSNLTVDATTLLALPDRLRAAQPTFDRTGGLHAAAIFTPDGRLLVAREDVGRHNALDKVLGWGLLNGLLPFERHVLMVSGRSSFEIMQKALAARVPIIACVSAPSSLAVDFAKDSDQTLIGFLRGQQMNIYSCPQRVRC